MASLWTRTVVALSFLSSIASAVPAGRGFSITPTLTTTLSSDIPVPSPTPTELNADTSLHSLDTRGFFNDLLSNHNPISAIKALQSKATSVVAAVKSDIAAAPSAASAYAALFTNIVPSPAPSSIEQALFIAKDASEGGSRSLIDSALRLKLQGLCVFDTATLFTGISGGINSYANNNPKNPSSPIYPKKDPSDPPYSIPESQLRAAIYIPPGYTGSKQTVILIPGTAVPAGITYANNFAKLLSAGPVGDPVWVNIPGNSLDDVQLNAEYVAYAINYMSSLSGGKVAAVTWSQGSLDVQWALKYFSSTRSALSDFIAISPDFHGTLASDLTLCTSPLLPCSAAARQQGYSSSFISTLRANGGSQAYVPTTTIYSATDIIVLPQSGTSASGYLPSSPLAPASNTELQSACPGKPAGGYYTHEGVLFHPLAWALAVDALTHDGPGQVGRLDLGRLCGELVAEGLDVEDVLATESVLVVAAVNALTSRPVWAEPGIRAYARS
ncbi:MAG: hypothetical protein M1814_005905 [Vezdaea aestivalis]|nr:MAG: hypothetical protein M1814_005905 [Vezdaea aestivalis]